MAAGMNRTAPSLHMNSCINCLCGVMEYIIDPACHPAELPAGAANISTHPLQPSPHHALQLPHPPPVPKPCIHNPYHRLPPTTDDDFAFSAAAAAV